MHGFLRKLSKIVAPRRPPENPGYILRAIKRPDRCGDRSSVCRCATRPQLLLTAPIRVSCETSKLGAPPILAIPCSLLAGSSIQHRDHLKHWYVPWREFDLSAVICVLATVPPGVFEIEFFVKYGKACLPL